MVSSVEVSLPMRQRLKIQIYIAMEYDETDQPTANRHRYRSIIMEPEPTAFLIK